MADSAGQLLSTGIANGDASFRLVSTKLSLFSFISVFTMKMAHFQARPASGLPGPAQLPQRPPDVSKMSPRCLQDVSQRSHSQDLRAKVTFAKVTQPRFHCQGYTAKLPLSRLPSQGYTVKVTQPRIPSKPCLGSRAGVI